MRKKILTLLSILFAVAVVLTLNACVNDSNALTHDWGDWTVEKAATCTDDGTQLRTCTVCDAEDESTIDALGHDWGDEIIEPAATCGSVGKSTTRCKECDAVYEQILPSTGEHDWQAAEVVAEATCTDDGKQIYQCSVCDKQEVRTISAHGHDFGTMHEAVAPTCVANGNVAYFQCSQCKQCFDENKAPLQNIVVNATGEHSWQAAAVTKQATCTQNGSQTYQCVVCLAEEQRDIVATGHSFGELVGEINPTCTKAGTKAHKQCVQCNDYFDAEGKFLSHSAADLAIPSTGVHVWDFSNDGVKWIWADDYAELSNVGVKVQLTCSTCDTKELRQASFAKDEDASSEPTSTEQGRYVYTAQLTVDGTTVTDTVFYVVPVVIDDNSEFPVVPDNLDDPDPVPEEKECWFVSSANDWAMDDPTFKFAKQSDGSYVLVVEISAGTAFKLVFDGVELGYSDVNRQFNSGRSTIFGKASGNSIRVSNDCTLRLVYNPDTNTLMLDVLAED